MIDPVQELKIRAELLHHRLAARQEAALARLHALPELRKASPPSLAAFAAQAQRKHCLAVVAREVGFKGWDHALRVLRGDSREVDFGDLLYPTRCAAYLNHWFSRHDEAHDLRRDRGGYLLVYRRHFFVADRGFIGALGLDPDDADWAAIGWDWARPLDVEARLRLYGGLLTSTKKAA